MDDVQEDAEMHCVCDAHTLVATTILTLSFIVARRLLLLFLELPPYLSHGTNET